MPTCSCTVQPTGWPIRTEARLTEEELAASKSQVSVKTVLTVCLTTLALATVVFVIIQTRLAVALTLAAVLVSVAVNHAIELLQRRGLRRWLAISLIVLTIALLLVGFSLLVIPPAINQGKALIAEFPHLLDRLRNTSVYQTLDSRFQIQTQFRQLSDQMYGHLQTALAPALKAIGGLLSVIAGTATVFFLVIFMLGFGEPLVKAALAEAMPSRRQRYQRILRKIYDSIGGYLAGLTLICTVNACLTTVFLAITRMPFFLPLGIVSGLSSLIPFVGPLVMGTLITVLAFLTGGPSRALVTAIYFVAYGQLEGQVLSPIVYRRTVNVNPLITLLSVLFFVELAGIAGAIIAVPIAASLQILLREFLAIRRERLNLDPPVATSTPQAPSP